VALTAVSVPTGIKVLADLVMQASYAAIGWVTITSPEDTGGQNFGRLGVAVSAQLFGGSHIVKTNASSQILLFADQARTTGTWIFTVGWYDNRGK
jgi:hypothetical protein